MSQTISAVYENGVLRLDEPLAVSEGVRVEIIVVAPKDAKSVKTPAELLAEVAALPTGATGEKFSNRDHDRILYGAKEKQ